MSGIVKSLYYIVVVASPLVLAISYKSIASIAALVFLFIFCISLKELELSNRKAPVLYLLLVFISFAALSAFWSYQPDEAVERLIKISFLIIPGIVLLASRHPAKYVQHETLFKLAGSALVLAALVSIWQLNESTLIKEIITAKPGRENKAAELTPMVACMSVFIWPMLLLIQDGAWRKQSKYLCIAVLVAALLLLLMLGDSSAAILASVIGGFSFIWIKAGKQTTTLKGLIVLSVILFFLLPTNLYQKHSHQVNIGSEEVFTESVLQTSMLHRLEIWDRCIELAKERPFFGWGISASRVLPKTDQPSIYRLGHKRTDFMYPHNIFIQCWLELGLLGLVILLVWLNSLLNWTENLTVLQRPYYVATIMSILTIYAFGNPVWRSWWIVFLLVIAMIFQIATSRSEDGLFANTKL